MAAEFRQTQKLEQGLALSPQLKRSLEILQAPSLDLREMVSAELRTNPLLEELSPAESAKDDQPQSVGEDIYADFDEPPPQKDASAEQAKRDFFLNSIPDKVSLQEYLLNEANLDAPNEGVAKAFAGLVGSLDDRGFLAPDALESAKKAGFNEDDIQGAMRLLRGCEPSGIGAFDMRDSLMLQLEHKGMKDTLAYRVLERHYDMLMKRKVAEIAALEGESEREVENAISEIAKLSTSPAHEFVSEEERFITPDLEYFKKDGTWTVELTNEHIPKLRINPEYRQMMAEGRLRKEEEGYVKDKIREGKFVMDAIEQRQKTLLKIGHAILQKQPEFFEKGPSALKPMTMQDVAEIVELHATTVGRAIHEKYATTPFGIFALKFFFSGGYESADGGGVASHSVKTRIREIIEGESPQKPLSDSKIADMLESEGISIARRTVAKYREEMNIAPKNLRKRF